MMVRLASVACVLAASSLSGQKPLDVIGTWKVEAGKDVKRGPSEVTIRADSSASWGKETVRWRLKGDQISIVLGGEWETHAIKITDNTMTLGPDKGESGLDKPVTLKRIGPATPRPAGTKIPDDPDH